MRPKRETLILRQTQDALRKAATGNYRKLLSSLLQDHRVHEEITGPLDAALRQKDYGLLFRLADSLSGQKYPDATKHFVANQFSLLIKKYPWPKDLLDLKPREAAISSFKSTERRMARINKKFTFLANHPVRDRFAKERGTARHWIRSVIGSMPDYYSVFEKSDFGPGASLGVHGNATNYARKFASSVWSVSPGAIHHGYAAMKHNYHLFEALCPKGGDGRFVCYDEEIAFRNYMSRLSVVTQNKISFVPKTAKTERSIAVEPLLNGFVQKGIDQVLRKKLLRVGIDLSDQGRNQELARLGSMNDSDDGFVTIDLKSASDSVSIELIRYLIPEDWYRLLDRTRSHSYELEGAVNGYQKFCSMGNGFCFPIETLIFAAACFAVGAGLPYTDFSVYGDDIIVRKRYAADLIALLGHWGFKINTEKTFLSGPFRESCGTDWFGGVDVRPFTLDFAPDSLGSVFKLLNLPRYRTRSKNFFAGSRDLVLNWVPEQFRFFRPLAGEVDTGIDSIGDEYLYASSCTFLPRNWHWRWRELVVSPKVDETILEMVGHEPWLMSVALRGAASIGFGRYKFLPEVTLRRETQTKVARKGYASTSNWLPGPVGKR